MADPVSIKIRRLGDFSGDCRELDMESFSKRHGEAFFLHHGPIGKLRVPSELQSTLAPESPGTTPERVFNPQADFLVFPVRRAEPDKPDDEMIWVGRTGENDIVIPDASVSVIHAFVKREGPDRFSVRDMRSMNGSFVNDEQVPAQGMGSAAKLESGARVRFGSVRLTFLKAPEFFSMVKLLDRV